MGNLRVFLISAAVMFPGTVRRMAYFFYFRTDGEGHVLREAGSPAAEASGQRLLGRADALMARGDFDPARQLPDSLRHADLNPNTFVATDALRRHYDSLRAQRRRAAPVR
ncbi:MAG: hypothetical protein H7Z21_09530 [Hymenobacter sp.]|nr:hypothetical protein [Hymenobacter sp.]